MTQENKLDILCVTESWLNENDSAKFCEIHELGFDFISVPRSGRGGGVAFIFRSALFSSLLHHPVKKFKSFEVTEVVLKNDKECIRLCLIYRPGVSSKTREKYEATKLKTFFGEFDDYLDDLVNKLGKPVSCGDFNFHLEDISRAYTRRFVEVLTCHDFVPFLDCFPTATHKDGGILDVFVISMNAQDQVDIVSVDVIMDTGTDSDHYLVIASIVFDIDGISRGRSRPVSFKKPVRELHLVDTDQMMLDLTNAFYENDLTQFVNVSCALDKYNTILQDTIDIHAPKIVKQYRHVKNCWWDYKCQEAHRKRRRAERTFRKNCSVLNRKLFYEACEEAKQVYSNQRETYYSNKLQSYRGDTRNTYKVVN